VDLVAELEKDTTVDAVNGSLKKASESDLKGYLKFSEEELVSCDFNNSLFSSIVDGLTTAVIGGNLVKVLAWYDNEMGYAARIVDLIRLIGKNL
jgi:glyceraldehyde 3-phosphate dehydrogenase